MVDLRVAIQKNLVAVTAGRQRLQRVGALAALFLVEQPLLEVLAVGLAFEQGFKVVAQFLISLLELILKLLHFAALVQWAREVARHLDMHRHRAAVAPDQRVDDLARLV